MAEFLHSGLLSMAIDQTGWDKTLAGQIIQYLMLRPSPESL
jgi:hypothetical protein